jgi:hypothetical protein
MWPRNQVRPRVEELGARVVPAGVLPLTGTHAFSSMLTAQFTPPATVTGSLAGNLLQGTLSLAGVRSTPPGGNPIDFTGALTITTRHGTVTAQGAGFVDVKAGTFTDTGTITGGTGRFRGASGTFTSQGSFNVLAGSLSGSFTGTISGRGAHRHASPQHNGGLHAVRFRAPDTGGSPSGGGSAATRPTNSSGGDPAANDGDIPSSNPGFFPTPVSGSNDAFGGVAPGNG